MHHVAQRCCPGNNLLHFIVAPDDSSFTKSVLSKLHITDTVPLLEFGVVIVEAVRNGAVVILDEIQNASPTLQVSLQRGIDHGLWENDAAHSLGNCWEPRAFGISTG